MYSSANNCYRLHYVFWNCNVSPVEVRWTQMKLCSPIFTNCLKEQMKLSKCYVAIDVRYATNSHPDRGTILSLPRHIMASIKHGNTGRRSGRVRIYYNYCYLVSIFQCWTSVKLVKRRSGCTNSDMEHCGGAVLSQAGERVTGYI